MHTTPTRKQIKQLKAESEELERGALYPAKVKKMEPGASEGVTEADRLRSEIEYLKPQRRLEAITVFKVENVKTAKKGETRRYEYWYTSWREEGKNRSVYLGSCRKMTERGSPPEGPISEG